MNRSDSYKSAVDAQPPPRPPPPQLARVDERNEFGAFNLIDYYLNERANEYTQPKQVKLFLTFYFSLIYCLFYVDFNF